MKTKHYFLILFVIQIGIILFSINNSQEPQSLNYDLYKYKFQQLENKFNDLESKSVKQDTIINQIKYQIISDEKTIRNASNSDVDSIFNAMVSRQHKGRL